VYTLCVVYLLLSRLLLFDYCTNRVYYIITSVHVWLRHTACVCGTSCNENKIRCKSYERLNHLTTWAGHIFEYVHWYK